MQHIEKNLNEKNQPSVKKQGAETRSLESTKTSEAESPTGSVALSKNLAQSLMGLIKDVNKDGVTPETVNASCNAAAQIYKILRLNYDMKKEGF